MAKRRITRKQLKRKDEFQTRAEKATVWLLELGWKKVLGGIVLIGALMLIIVVVQNLTSKAEDSASALFSKALAKFDEAIAGESLDFEKKGEKFKEALALFDQVINEYGSTASADFSEYFRILCFHKMGDKDKTYKEGEALFEDTSSDLVRNQIGFFLMDQYLADSKIKEARSVEERMEDNSNSALNMNSLYYMSGLIYEAENKIDSAVQEYMKVIKNENLNSFKREAQERILIINPSALKELQK